MNKKQTIIIVYKSNKQKDKIRELLMLLTEGKINTLSPSVFATPRATVMLKSYNSNNFAGLRADKIFILQDYETDINVLNSIRMAEVQARIDKTTPDKEDWF
jgi:hypothetical protein